MGINFSIKTSIKFNGKEYGSVDEMPDDVRQAYQGVMASIKNPAMTRSTGFSFQFASKPKIVFNGVEYAGVDQMPPEIRKTYERMMAAVGAAQGGVPADLLEGQPAVHPPANQNVPGVRSPLTLGATGTQARGTPPATRAIIGILVLIVVGLLILLWKKSSP